jgi:hypothetical protein
MQYKNLKTLQENVRRSSSIKTAKIVIPESEKCANVHIQNRCQVKSVRNA